MKTFKEMIQQDNQTVFLSPEEFAENTLIDGIEVEVVIDNDQLNEYQLKNGGEGLANSRLLFFVVKEKLPFEPFPGQNIEFNGRYTYVIDVQEDEGMYSITLEVPES